MKKKEKKSTIDRIACYFSFESSWRRFDLAKILNEILNDDWEGNEAISSPSVSSFLLSSRAHPGKINPSHFPLVFLSCAIHSTIFTSGFD